MRLLDGNLIARQSQVWGSANPAKGTAAVTTDRRQSDITAPREAWKLLGELLEARRLALGYRYRTELERDRGLNKRMQADIEKAYEARINTFPAGTLRHIAEVYEVTYDSVLAVLAGQAHALTPAVPAEPPGQLPPLAEPARAEAARPFLDRINQRLRQLAARGITDPSGAQVFGEGTADAQTWDGVGERLPIDDRVWFIADLQRRDAGRGNGSGAGMAG